MAIDGRDLRNAMGLFATGVTVITTKDTAGKPFGLTANAFSSLSLDPPLLLICVDKGVDCYNCFEESKVFAVNFLSLRSLRAYPIASGNSVLPCSMERWRILSARSPTLTRGEITRFMLARFRSSSRHRATRSSFIRGNIVPWPRSSRGLTKSLLTGRFPQRQYRTPQGRRFPIQD